MAGHVAYRLHQPARPAAIELLSLGFLHDRPEVERARGMALVVMNGHLTVELRPRQLVAEGRHGG